MVCLPVLPSFAKRKTSVFTNSLLFRQSVNPPPSFTVPPSSDVYLLVFAPYLLALLTKVPTQVQVSSVFLEGLLISFFILVVLRGLRNVFVDTEIK